MSQSSGTRDRSSGNAISLAKGSHHPSTGATNSFSPAAPRTVQRGMCSVWTGRSGGILWQKEVSVARPESPHKMNSFATSTCAATSDRVLAFFGPRWTPLLRPRRQCPVVERSWPIPWFMGGSRFAGHLGRCGDPELRRRGARPSWWPSTSDPGRNSGVVNGWKSPEAAGALPF